MIISVTELSDNEELLRCFMQAVHQYAQDPTWQTSSKFSL